MSVRKWKAAKAIIATVAIVAFAGFAIGEGADETTTTWLALATVALINGFELSELLAVYVETSRDTESSGE
jgi:hypothetical protein